MQNDENNKSIDDILNYEWINERKVKILTCKLNENQLIVIYYIGQKCEI